MRNYTRPDNVCLRPHLRPYSIFNTYSPNMSCLAPFTSFFQSTKRIDQGAIRCESQRQNYSSSPVQVETVEPFPQGITQGQPTFVSTIPLSILNTYSNTLMARLVLGSHLLPVSFIQPKESAKV